MMTTFEQVAQKTIHQICSWLHKLKICTMHFFVENVHQPKYFAYVMPHKSIDPVTYTYVHNIVCNCNLGGHWSAEVSE